ncbi:MAG: SoxR reducing system RseC family protein [Treponema sp.]|nr:SoxR reducing system RseC family protein [Treponema sp.]
MNTLYIVETVNGNAATVRPAENASSCATCSANCSSCDISFTAANTKRFKLTPGQKVKIKLSARHEARQGFFSLIIPVACAICGFFAASPVAMLFGKEANENMRAFFVLLFLAISCIAVMLISRKKMNAEKIEIAAIC